MINARLVPHLHYLDTSQRQNLTDSTEYKMARLDAREFVALLFYLISSSIAHFLSIHVPEYYHIFSPAVPMQLCSLCSSQQYINLQSPHPNHHLQSES